MAKKKKDTGYSDYKDAYYFEELLEGKKIPLVVLDNKWHALLDQAGCHIPAISTLESEIIELMKEEGNVTQKIPDARKFKKKLLDEIMELAAIDDAAGTRAHLKQIKKNQKLVEECNDLIERLEERKKDIPLEMQALNRKLMIITLQYCYAKMQDNADRINAITDWVNRIRAELKDNLGTKEELLDWNKNMYAYMHALFGADIIDMFDLKYNE